MWWWQLEGQWGDERQPRILKQKQKYGLWRVQQQGPCGRSKQEGVYLKTLNGKEIARMPISYCCFSKFNTNAIAVYCDMSKMDPTSMKTPEGSICPGPEVPHLPTWHGACKCPILAISRKDMACSMGFLSSPFNILAPKCILVARWYVTCNYDTLLKNTILSQYTLRWSVKSMSRYPKKVCLNQWTYQCKSTPCTWWHIYRIFESHLSSHYGVKRLPLDYVVWLKLAHNSWSTFSLRTGGGIPSPISSHLMRRTFYVAALP